MKEQIRAKAKELLEAKEIDCFIGYERASDGLTARPFFAYEPGETERLIFDQTCVHNLARYLLEKRDKRTGILVKPCDARAINLLLQEKQIKRERIYIVGVVCEGVYKVSWGKLSQEIEPHCRYCYTRIPPIYDLLIGQLPKEEKVPSFPDLERLETKLPEERKAFWDEFFRLCIRCYACRRICPGCYCPQCFVEQLDPLWVGIRIALPENRLWNIGRSIHLAGRCVECGECQRVCPVGIPLMLLNQKLNSEVKKLFAFEPGLSVETPPPFATYKKEEEF